MEMKPREETFRTNFVYLPGPCSKPVIFGGKPEVVTFYVPRVVSVTRLNLIWLSNFARGQGLVEEFSKVQTVWILHHVC